VNAAEIFGLIGGKETSIEVAVKRIDQIAQNGMGLCLIVTQLDRVKGGLPKEVNDIAESHDGDPNYDDTQARRILTEWLDQNVTDNKKALRQRLSMVERVFFVWTEGIPDRPAFSYGLAKFIGWCFDTDWNKINRK
jgi:hypothetical protein